MKMVAAGAGVSPQNGSSPNVSKRNDPWIGFYRYRRHAGRDIRVERDGRCAGSTRCRSRTPLRSNAHCASIPIIVIRQLIKRPRTDAGRQRFLADGKEAAAKAT